MGYYSAWPALKQQAALAITRGLSDDVGSAYTVMVTTEGRLESWPEALARWPDWILLGEGVPKYYHNAILSAAVQSGALAGALALALLVCLAVAAWRVFSDYGRRLAPHLAAGAAASVIAGLVVNMFEAVAMTGSRPGTLLWWLAVLVVVRHTRVPRSANARGAHQDRSGLHSGSEGAMPESRRQTAARL